MLESHAVPIHASDVDALYILDTNDFATNNLNGRITFWLAHISELP